MHQLLSHTEVEEVQRRSRGRMKATPYLVNGKQLEFSYDRTSKVNYLSERREPLARRLSRRLELAMGLQVPGEDWKLI